ncbi:MAG TPA: hypothetical protein VGO50_11965 [Pyrinomonadaceae bacterium]|jgi:hypothetical protein|nr:hypothetical protein [Pyrinomonadaceae bacterium]
MKKKTANTEKREKFRQQFFKDEDAWTGEDEKGWFKAPRTLPLILQLLSSKKLSGKGGDPSKVYFELLSRHIDEGVIEMTDEKIHAYASGYEGTRGVRTWQERMKKLEETGFIKTIQIGNQRYKYVLLIHPTVIIENLWKAKKIDKVWYNTYRSRQIEVKEDSFEERQKRKNINVVPISSGKNAINE